MKYKGAREGYEPTNEAKVDFSEKHKLDKEARRARRERNKAKKKKIHSKHKHGR